MSTTESAGAEQSEKKRPTTKERHILKAFVGVWVLLAGVNQLAGASGSSEGTGVTVGTFVGMLVGAGILYLLLIKAVAWYHS